MNRFFIIISVFIIGISFYHLMLPKTANSEFQKDSGLRIDDVHPNARGYKIMAQRIAKVIQSLL